MEPRLVEIRPFTVAGRSVRTTNREEADPATARIPGLWARFHREGRPGVPHGVYAAYAAGADGPYDLTVGVPEAGTPDLASVRVEGGPYLVFEGRGPLPGAVLDTWTRIWAYFREPGAPARRFGTDFETYPEPGLVLVHVSLR